jgi:hypothetical protein
MNLIYPKCIICDDKWDDDPRDILWENESLDLFCSNNHDTIWYSQSKDGECSFDRNIHNLCGHEFLLRYNCNCVIDACRNKNVIYNYSHTRNHGWHPDKIIKIFDPPLPLNVSHEDLWNKIEHLLVLL